MELTDRLKQFIDYKGISLNAFDRSIDAGVGYIGKQIAKKASVGSDVLKKIFFVYPDLNLNWLLIGEGEMLNKSKEYAHSPPATSVVAEDITPYIQLAPPAKGSKTNKNVTPTVTPKDNLEVKTVYLSPKIITVDHTGNENILWVPVKAQAGYLIGYEDPQWVETLPSFNLPGLPTGTYRAFEVDGDSMFPTMKNSEMVIGQWVEKFDYIREDRVYIVVTKEGVLIKRVLNRIEKHGVLILKSDALDNRNLYPNITVKPEDVIEIWYAVWHGGFDFQSPSDTWRRINNHEADITVLQNTIERMAETLKKAGIG